MCQKVQLNGGIGELEFTYTRVVRNRCHNGSNGGIKDGLVANSWANTINGAGRNNYLVYKIQDRRTACDRRKTTFDLNLFGSDEVIRAFNNLMKHTYEAEATGNQDPEKMMRLWGKLLLEIRKSLGNKKTKLNELDMLRAMIKDMSKIEQE